MSRIAHLIAAKVCKDELAASRMLGYSEQDGRFRAFQALEETIQRAIGPDPIELWPVSDATEQTK
jgi:hypothetical protein